MFANKESKFCCSFFGFLNLCLAFGMGEPLGTKSLLLDILCGFSLSFRVLTGGSGVLRATVTGRDPKE